MEIDNFPDYLIYPDGKVWSKRRKIYLKHRNTCGYKFISLCKNGKHNQFYIHRLVGQHYIRNPENKQTIDHINRDKSDNRVENLRWATMKEQCENKGMKNSNTSGHEGISYYNRDKIWTYKKEDSKYKHFRKSFKSKIDAICFKYICLLKIKSQLV